MTGNELGLFLPSLLLNALTSSYPSPSGAQWTAPHWGTSLNSQSPFLVPGWCSLPAPLQWPCLPQALCLPPPPAVVPRPLLPPVSPWACCVLQLSREVFKCKEPVFAFLVTDAQSSALHSQRFVRCLANQLICSPLRLAPGHTQSAHVSPLYPDSVLHHRRLA